jgi:uncharacterized membrane protein
VAFVLTMAVATAAVGVEMLEALAIVLAVGVERRMRDALIGALAAVVAVVALCAALGPALLYLAAGFATVAWLAAVRIRVTPPPRAQAAQ